jgi:general secretion pathway protein H
MTARRHAGFTLLEIMVVVVMIGILTAMLAPSFSLGGRERELALEADVLAQRLALARDESVVRGIELGIEFTPEGYRFVQWNPRRQVFNDLAADWARFAVRELPEGIGAEVSGEAGEALAALLPPAVGELPQAAAGNQGGQTAADDTLPARAPVVFILSSGEITPFTVTFVADDHEPVEAVFDFLGNRRLPDDAAPGAVADAR